MYPLVHQKLSPIALADRSRRAHIISLRVAVISAKNHKRQRRKRQSVTAKVLNRNTNHT